MYAFFILEEVTGLAFHVQKGGRPPGPSRRVRGPRPAVPGPRPGPTCVLTAPWTLRDAPSRDGMSAGEPRGRGAGGRGAVGGGAGEGGAGGSGPGPATALCSGAERCGRALGRAVGRHPVGFLGRSLIFCQLQAVGRRSCSESQLATVPFSAARHFRSGLCCRQQRAVSPPVQTTRDGLNRPADPGPVQQLVFTETVTASPAAVRDGADAACVPRRDGALRTPAGSAGGSRVSGRRDLQPAATGPRTPSSPTPGSPPGPRPPFAPPGDGETLCVFC